MAEKKPEFVVSDRRKFTEEGELRQDLREEAPGQQPAQGSQTAPTQAEPIPQPPSHAEQDAQQAEYRASGRKLDDMLAEGGHGTAEDFEMTFERLVQSLYVTALVQLGMMHREGESPRPDIIGARQTIDTLGVLKDKTKGNLSAAEDNLLQNMLFELRMAFLEMTNAITRAPGQPSGKQASK
jgi:hypothetical protein